MDVLPLRQEVIELDSDGKSDAKKWLRNIKYKPDMSNLLESLIRNKCQTFLLT